MVGAMGTIGMEQANKLQTGDDRWNGRSCVNVERILSCDIDSAMRAAMVLYLAQAAMVASWAPP